MTRLLRILKTDNQILDAIQNGDDSALGILYERNLRMITKYVLNNQGTEFEAQEILQDTLVIFWEKVRNKSYQQKSKISTFLFAIAKNRWLQELSRRKRHTDLDAMGTQRDDAHNAEEAYQEKEMAEIVRQCMARLSDLCRKILTYYYYDQKSMTEISRLTGLANDNVAKAKKYQCKKELEKLVKSALY